MDGALDQVISLLLLVAYYVFFEAIWNRTPGKFVFGTIVVAAAGGKPTFGQIVGRTLCRFIPFEPLSCAAGKGWHDRIPKARVVLV